MYLITVAAEGKPSIEFTAVAWLISNQKQVMLEIFHSFVRHDVKSMLSDGFGRQIVHGIPMKHVLRHGRTRSALRKELNQFHEKYEHCPIIIDEKNCLHQLYLKKFQLTAFSMDGNKCVMIPWLEEFCPPINHRKKTSGRHSDYRCSLKRAWKLGMVYGTSHGYHVVNG